MDEQRQPVPLERRHPPIWWVLTRFEYNLDALRDMLATAVPHMRVLDEPALDPNAREAIQRLPDANRKQLMEYLDRLAAKRKTAPPDQDEPSTDAAKPEDATADLVSIFQGDAQDAAAFLRNVQALVIGPSRTSIALNSLLAMTVGAFDVLMAGLMTRYYIGFPDALAEHDKEPKFSIADVRELRSEADALDLLIKRRVSKIMYGTPEDWSGWFKRHCGESLKDLALDWWSIREIFERRHVVLHNGGLVSSEYLARLDFSGREAPSLGDRLEVDDDYVANALDQLDIVGSAVAILAWGSWLPDQRDRSAGRLLSRAYTGLTVERWRVTERLAAIGERPTFQCTDGLRLALRCNRWLARAEQNGYASIHEEVAAWDESALSPQFRFVRLVLLQDLSAALKLAPSVIASEEISKGELRAWPILRTFREYPGYDAFAAEHDI